MPEIAEGMPLTPLISATSRSNATSVLTTIAARIVHFLKTHLVGKRINVAKAIEDVNVFGKAGTTGDEVTAAFKGKKVVGAGSQGKYFW